MCRQSVRAALLGRCQMKSVKILFSLIVILLLFIAGCKKEKGDFIRTGDGKKSGEESGLIKNGSKSGTYDKKYLGSYRLRITGFTGVLKLYEEDDALKGTIQFSSWGRGKEQPLKKVRITGEKIYFIRSVSTRRELEEFGGSRYFKQEFYGSFSGDGSRVKGYFKDSGAQNSWDGRK